MMAMAASLKRWRRMNRDPIKNRETDARKNAAPRQATGAPPDMHRFRINR